MKTPVGEAGENVAFGEEAGQNKIADVKRVEKHADEDGQTAKNL